MGEFEYHSPIELFHLLCMKRIIIILLGIIGLTNIVFSPKCQTSRHIQLQSWRGGHSEQQRRRSS